MNRIRFDLLELLRCGHLHVEAQETQENLRIVESREESESRIETVVFRVQSRMSALL